MADETARHYQPRGSKEEIISTKQKTTGAADILSKFIKTGETDDPETLVDIKVNNPLKRLYALLQDIKKHQATTFSLKFTIPLIALPIFLLIAFQLGKGQAECRQINTSKIGVIKKVTVETPQTSSNPLSSLRSLFSFLPGTEQTTQYKTEDKILLIDPAGEPITLYAQKQLNVENFGNYRVIITGNYSSCTNVMTLVSDKNISRL